MEQTSKSSEELDYFLVCGLGSLGQHCVNALQEFGVKIIAIEQIQQQNWEIANIEAILTELIIGDCRQNNILKQAKLERCRAALIVTSSEQVNTETALAIRQLNPYIRLVVRSSKANLNQLLTQRLDNFIAFDTYQLSTSAFALAALSTETLGFFCLDGNWLRVIEHQFQGSESWCNSRRLHELHHRRRHLLTHISQENKLVNSFYQWQPEALIQPGDKLAYIEKTTEIAWDTAKKQQLRANTSQLTANIFSHNFYQILIRFWQQNFRQQVQRVVFFCGLIVLILLLVGTGLFYFYYPDATLFSAFYATAILLLGGYGDLFGDFQEITIIPWWLQLFALGLTLVGTALVGVLYALLTQAILSTQFKFVKKRPPIPRQNHIIIVGLGKMGQKIAQQLQQWQQALVGITIQTDSENQILPNLPILSGNLTELLTQANLETAKSIVVATDDEILNLEIALMSKTISTETNLVIRTSGQRLSQHLTTLLPKAQILGANEVVAEAFAGAAFGENILTLFRLHNQTVLVTEYQVETGDTLNGLVLAEFAYGYEVVPILYQKPSHPAQIMPSDDLFLSIGDRLVILATIEGLQRIEQGQLKLDLKCWQVKVEKAITSDAIFDGANLIARISGCNLMVAREIMNNLPQTLPFTFYQHQAQFLVRELNRTLVKASLIS